MATTTDASTLPTMAKGNPLPSALNTYDQTNVIHDATLGDLYPSTQYANVYYSVKEGTPLLDEGDGNIWDNKNKTRQIGYTLDDARAKAPAAVAAAAAEADAASWLDDPTLGKIKAATDNPGWYWSDTKQDWFHDDGSGQIWWDKSQSWEDVGGSPAARATSTVTTDKPVEQIVSQDYGLPLAQAHLDAIATAADKMKAITDKLDPAMQAAVNQVMSMFGAVKDADGNTVLPSMTDQRMADLQDAVAKVTAGNDKYTAAVTSAVTDYANQLKTASDQMYGTNAGAPGMVYDARLGGWLQDAGAKDPSKAGQYWDYTNQRWILDEGNGKIKDMTTGVETAFSDPKPIGSDYKADNSNTLKGVLNTQVSGYQQGQSTLTAAQTGIVAEQAAGQKDNLLTMIGQLKSAIGDEGSAESTELTKYQKALTESAGGLSDAQTADLQTMLKTMSDGLGKYGAQKQGALNTMIESVKGAADQYVKGKQTSIADELTAKRQAEAQDFQSKQTSLTNEVGGLRDNINRLHDSMAGNLSAENQSQLANLDAMIADAGQNLSTYSDAQKSSLAAEIGKNLSSLEDDFTNRRAVLQDQLTQLKDTAGQQAHSVRADVQAELDKMNSALDNLSTVRETTAKTVQASINIGAQKTADQLAAAQAGKGFAGASSFGTAAQSRALIEGRQAAAAALGSAREQSALDKVTGAQYATGQISTASQADAAAEENRINRQVAAGNTSLDLTTSLENQYGASKEAIQNQEASDYRAISDQLAKGQLDLNTMGATDRQTLLDYLATESRKLGDDQATGLKTVADFLRSQGSANEVAHANSVLANYTNQINESKAAADEAGQLYYDINTQGAAAQNTLSGDIATQQLANTNAGAAAQQVISDAAAVKQAAVNDLISKGRKDLADQIATDRLNVATLSADNQKTINDSLTNANAAIKGNAAQADYDINKFLTEQTAAQNTAKIQNANDINTTAANLNLKTYTDAAGVTRDVTTNAAIQGQTIAEQGRQDALNNINVIPQIAGTQYDWSKLPSNAAEQEYMNAWSILSATPGANITAPLTSTTKVTPASADQPTLGSLGAGLVSLGGNLAMADMFKTKTPSPAATYTPSTGQSWYYPNDPNDTSGSNLDFSTVEETPD